jgi:hypothetical protein
VLVPYLQVKQADARLLREYCTFVLEHPHPGAAGRVYGAREWENLALFAVGPTMAARPTRGARSVVLASAPVLFDPAALGALDLAWLGGFFDGEGSITYASRLRHTSGITYTLPLVRISNTHMPVLPYVRAIMDASGLAYDCSPHCVSPQDRKLPFWTLGTQGVTRTSAWLTVLLPYLHTKRGQAEEMLEYCRQHPGSPRVRSADATRIRELYATGSYTQQQLAAMVGLCYSTVNRILAQDRPAAAQRHLRRRPAPPVARTAPPTSSEPAE